MDILNAVEPTPKQIKDFLAHKKAGEPVYMLNLLKFKEKASYRDGEDISGREAYSRYAHALTEILQQSGIEGFEIRFSGNINAFLIGAGSAANNTAPAWDAAAIIRYPNAKVMIEQVSSEAYRKIHKHRRAGLEGQLLIACDDDGIF